MQPIEHPKYEEMVAALVQCPTEAEAVAQVGINRSTLYRWKKDPGFQRLYEEARRELYEHVITQVQAAATEAVSALREIMANPEAQENNRVSAARIILNNNYRMLSSSPVSENHDRKLTVADIIASVELDEEAFA